MQLFSLDLAVHIVSFATSGSSQLSLVWTKPTIAFYHLSETMREEC